MIDQNNSKKPLLVDLIEKSLKLNQMYIELLNKEKEKILQQKTSYLMSKEN